MKAGAKALAIWMDETIAHQAQLGLPFTFRYGE